MAAPNRIQLLCLGGAFLLSAALVPRIGIGQDDAAIQAVAQRLSAWNGVIGDESQRKRWAAQIAEQQRMRLRQANQRSSAEWNAVHDRLSWEQMRDPKLDALRQSLGQWPPPPERITTEIVGQFEGDGFILERIAFESRPGWWVAANRYRPAKPGPTAPGLLIVHAHHTPKEHAELQDMGMTWARHGCVVLVPDQLGHGERRQHPFVTTEDGERAVAAWDQLAWQHRDQFAQPPREPSSLPKATFRLSRQDYYFRYDSALQLYLAGESLIGWMAWDLMRAVDVLLATPGVDAQRLAILGSVAGGGDPAAVTAALDPRLTVAVPFNFGGPQPETRYPLPEDAETSFNYAGSGSWESTRNLARSAADGFLPWVIVGSVAPRHLIFAHEFHWDQPRDPVWRRLTTIYQFYEKPEGLAFTHGQGELRQTAQEATHCTHIGAPHRVRIHAAFERWFDLRVTKASEYSRPLPKNELLVVNDEFRVRRKPNSLRETLTPIVDQRLAAARQSRAAQTPAAARASLRRDLEKLLGGVTPDRVSAPLSDTRSTQSPLEGVDARRIVLRGDEGFELPLVILTSSDKKPAAVVVAVSQAGKAGFLRQRSTELARLLRRDVAVVLPDLRGMGEAREDDGRGRTSSDTSRSATEWMLGRTQLGGRVRDLRGLLAYLRSSVEFQNLPVALWGDSFATRNPPGELPVVPHDAERRPALAEPGGALLVLLTALFEPEVRGVLAAGGLSSWRGVLEHSQILVPHDVIIPGILTTADVPDLAASLAPRPLCFSATITARNQLADETIWERDFAETARAYAENPSAWSPAGSDATQWLERVLLP